MGDAVKIFISHSSIDKWIARRISQDLEGLGATTFLDEKDIETGDSIDATIQAHLKDCDEILMLLSPQALKSHWVLLEIGGAKALEKRLVPIILHVAPNELPSPLSAGLARDINDVDKYYDEVSKRLAGAPTPPSPTVSPHRRLVRTPRRLRIGQTVRIRESVPPKDRVESVIGWVPAMEAYLGQVAVITGESYERDSRVWSYELDIDDGAWWWAAQWLREPIPVKEIGGQPNEDE